MELNDEGNKGNVFQNYHCMRAKHKHTTSGDKESCKHQSKQIAHSDQKDQRDQSYQHEQSG